MYCMKKSYQKMLSLLKTITGALPGIFFLIPGTPIIAQVAADYEYEIVRVAPAPEAYEVCTFEPLFIDLGYYRRAEQMMSKESAASRTATFEIDYFVCEDLENCTPENEAPSPWPQEAKNAFVYGLDIWGSHIDSDVPIRIEAKWVSLECEQGGKCTLGSAGPTRIVQLSGEGAEPDTWYSIAQGSAMTGQDIVSQIPDEDYDIVVNMNSDFPNWYFGTDGNTPSGEIDFVTVILHEVGHGLGFTGSMNVENDMGAYGLGDASDPIIYDIFAYDGNESRLVDTGEYPNPSTALGEALTGQRNGVFFRGNDAQNVNAGLPVPLYAPLEWDGGSSFSHLDEDTYTNTENALMRPRINSAFALHSPGPVMCGMFSDKGWPIGLGCRALVAAEAYITVSELSLDFGVSNVGKTVERSFTITNEPDAVDPLNGRLEIDNQNYRATAGFETFSINPGETQTITIRYRPQSDNIHNVTAQIFHNGNNQISPVELRLTGESLRKDEIARIEQNYPNPFNPTTTIPLILPEDSNVKLEVFNVMGQRVQTLVDGHRASGRYPIQFDGSQLASGMYIYRIVVNNFSDTKNLLIVK